MDAVSGKSRLQAALERDEPIQREGPASAPTGLMPRATVEVLVRHRNRALELFAAAHDALTATAAAFDAAHAERRRAAPLRETRYNAHQSGRDNEIALHVKVPDREAFIATARRFVDVDVWAHVLEVTDLERLMDRKAKDDLQQQLLTEPPEATVENIRATLDQFALDAGMIFRRGIANCFSSLDRRFRSHDGFRVGHRIILARMFDEHGWWNFHRNMEATLLDVARTFLVLDGVGVPPSYAGIVGKLNAHRSTTGHGARQGRVEDEYFDVRIFKNGNCHVWFKRNDLLLKVNRLLGEYYGEVVPDARQADEDPLKAPKTALAKHFGFYPTPDKLAGKILDEANLSGRNRLSVLEPSAGTGQLAHLAAAGRRHLVDCVEVQPALAATLKAEGVYRRVLCCDFLNLLPDPAALYDRVVMNPPFDRERDIDHVMHALGFLKPDGFLVAVMSAGTEFRETRKSAAFRELMAKMKARFQDLPAGSFSSVGTNCNTVLLRVWKDGRYFYG